MGLSHVIQPSKRIAMMIEDPLVEQDLDAVTVFCGTNYRCATARWLSKRMNSEYERKHTPQ
jgi:hypothetical protein